MNKTSKKEIQNFIKSWSTGAHEVADKVTFWNTILRFLGVPQEQIDNRTFIDYEKSIKLKENEHFNGSIDAYIPSTKVLIEQKTSGVDLSKPEIRPNGGHTEKITPFEQARRYDAHLSANEHANFYVLCNFDQIIIYDIRESVDTKPITIELKDLDKDLNSLDFLVNTHENRIQKEQQISVDAGKLVSKMYDELLDIFSNYPTLDDEKVRHSINELCVRLVFCLYAEDAGLFSSTEAFYDYLKDVAPNQIGLKLKELFEVLNTEDDDRNKKDQFWKDEHPVLETFPYVNGGLFANTDIFIPPFTQKLKDILLNEASMGFNWKSISPTIFGAVFESTLNPETRRQGGMHYTSVQNIHKVIDPLFLNDLKTELKQIKAWKQPKKKQELAKAFQMKLSRLTFFDPACGSGNFLTETYLSLRKLENEALRIQYPNPVLDVGDSDEYIKVSIQQFYGIEINDFAVSVAKTALWIAESQMMEETKDIFYANWDFLPLKTYTRIHEGNALRLDWNEICPNYECSYVMGNPPFIGRKFRTPDQDADLKKFFDYKDIDYVACWFKKAAQYMKGTTIHCAFVATNSITQGEQVYPIWNSLINDYKMTINFAYKSFVWDNDTQNKAHVHVVIIGFSYIKDIKDKYIFANNQKQKANQINGYLLDAPNVYILSSSKPLDTKLKLINGNVPLDGNALTVMPEELPEFKDFRYIKRLVGAQELLHNRKRYVLWLVNAPASEIKKCPAAMRHIKLCREKRMKLKSAQKLVDTPTLFRDTHNPKSFIAVPVVSSQRRKYVPMAFLNDNYIPMNAIQIIPDATIYDFGILESIVHMAWMRVVAGRLKSDYRYSKNIVYNDFPWPRPTQEQREKIKQTAQEILDIREKYPNESLADLYDPMLMKPDLIKAHKANDCAVMEAYGFDKNLTESEIVAHLFKMYENLTK
ncbi:DNA methyltransferase [Lactobacillus gallinarum]|uniref:DNA methyltransferase n=1 Tax=Lactobacillus gallinarum TaxID=52242 RepID=UPI00195A63A4|nr:DNA methyltransferase [Lactobacillus gallinarum]MBM6973847.1 methylase [Lactobacillus gallinarum]